MSNPCEVHVKMLKRIGRYLIHRPRVGLTLPVQPFPKVADAKGDSDHAGCVISRKSTSGGIVKVGRASLLSWSTTQATPSLSSGESEWHGITKTSAEGLGVQAGLQDFNVQVKLRAWTDSTAALGIGKRKGLGKLKHVESRYFGYSRQSKMAGSPCIKSQQMKMKVMYLPRTWGEKN